MYTKLILPAQYFHISSGIKKKTKKLRFKLHEKIAGSDSSVYLHQEHKNSPKNSPEFQSENNSQNKNTLQLYKQLIAFIETKNKKILEVGSGRGNGASYIYRHYMPQQYTGIDLSGKSIEYCKSHYNIPGLEFMKGEPENLPFPSHSYDVVINVQFIQSFINTQNYFDEVYRVLTRGGHFLMTDMIKKEFVDKICYQLIDIGFEIVSVKDMTDKIIANIEENSIHSSSKTKKQLHDISNNPYQIYPGGRTDKSLRHLSNGTYEYWSYVLKKP